MEFILNLTFQVWTIAYLLLRPSFIPKRRDTFDGIHATINISKGLVTANCQFFFTNLVKIRYLSKSLESMIFLICCRK